MNAKKLFTYACITQQYKLPPISEWLAALLFILLPNLILWPIAASLGMGRPIINLDYLLPAVLITLPWRGVKIISGLSFALFMLADIAMMTMQIFPFMDLGAVIYLAPFLVKAPIQYQIMAIGTLLIMVVVPLIWAKWSYKQHKIVVWVIAMMILLIGRNTTDFMYREFQYERFGKNNYFYAHSQIQLWREENNNDFMEQMRNEPKLKPLHFQAASNQLNKPYSNKILFIVAESWGYAREESVQQAILQKIYDHQDKLNFIKRGYFNFSGSTVQGEMRELCYLEIFGGYALHKTPSEQFTQCWPNLLKKEGYYTVAMHGASGQMYDRDSWYRKAGFDHTIFAENLMDRPACRAFNGACDYALYKEVQKAFTKHPNKVLFYWLTLTSHYPYPESDMVNPRLDCDKYNLIHGEICNNLRLEAQFFDGLAELIDKPEMKGVEVIIVGDHMPPIFGDVPLYKNLRWADVGWVHFKIKE